MNVIRKISPKGVDYVIDRIQSTLENYLPWDNFNCYPRIYKENIKDGIIPMLFTGGKDYKDAFFNDKVNGNCFFYEEDTRNAVRGDFNGVKLSIIFQLKLRKLYPNIIHRPDEEVHNDVILALKKNSLSSEITGLTTKLSSVYSDFDQSQLAFDDIGSRHVFRIDLSVSIEHFCSN